MTRIQQLSSISKESSSPVQRPYSSVWLTMMSEKVGEGGGGEKKCGSTTKAGQTHLSSRVFGTWCCHLHCTLASDLLSSAESPPRFRKAQALLSESIAWDHKNHISPRLGLTSNCLICRVLPRGLHHHLTIKSERRLGVSVRKIRILETLLENFNCWLTITWV